MSSRNAPQTRAFQQHLRACEHRDKVLADKDSTLQQRQSAELNVNQARRYMYNTLTLKKGDTVAAAFRRIYPELS